MTRPTTDVIAASADGTTAAVPSQPVEPDFRAVLDAVDLLLTVFDADGRLRFQNWMGKQKFAGVGIEPESLIGLTHAEISRILLEHGVVDEAAFRRMVRRDARDTIDVVGRRSAIVRRLPLPDGGFLVMTTEETDIRRAEQVVAEEQRLATIGSLVAGIAHEINTPLGVAVTAASFLRDALARTQVAMRSGAMTAEEAERSIGGLTNAVSLILTNLDRSVELVRGVKALAADPVGDDRQRVRIRRLVTGVVATLKAEARRNGRTILVDCPTDVELVTSPGALAQVLTNLIVNSLRHGFVDRTDGTVLVTVVRLERQLRIVVGDDGVGVAPDGHRRMFEPFFTTRRHHGDRGLGLTVVHNLVTRRLGGTIETEGAPGEGLRQIVTVPVP